jgi:cytochrome P450
MTVMIDPDALQHARHHAQTMPLDEIDMSATDLYRNGVELPYFARLRRDAPVHWQPSGQFGAFWSVTKFNDIMAVDTNHEAFSSDWRRGGISVIELPPRAQLPSFIAMDPPRHDDERKVVTPIVAPGNLAKLSHTIRERAVDILDHLPRGEVFDWVDRVSIELTTRMLATLFDFPFEDRRLLTHWSNVSTCTPPRDQARVLGRARWRTAQLPRVLHSAVERAGQRAAGQRPDLDARAFAGDPEHDARGIPGQPDPADRGRQRHDPQFHHRRADVPDDEPRSDSPSCGPTVR